MGGYQKDYVRRCMKGAQTAKEAGKHEQAVKAMKRGLENLKLYEEFTSKKIRISQEYEGMGEEQMKEGKYEEAYRSYHSAMESLMNADVCTCFKCLRYMCLAAFFIPAPLAFIEAF